MSLNNIFDIAGTGMSAQTLRLNTTASNLANAETASSSTGETYRARKPVFAAIQQAMMAGQDGGFKLDGQPASAGVEVREIIESDAPLRPRFEPHHPMADEEGYVYYPNVNVVEEMADMMSASRSFQTNAEVVNTAKSMMQRVLTLGQ
ncbi:flagellar basal body rod protein FlgC [Hydrocarboniclastica marina]|uniref:Flagellar basal-body rod protein FlgC n=1 Tax=Hydrocarboniclastica marina TaxID=2259620 RepID=A0A4P7XHC2_9ALTE|nr:flagellar basal body rod protein FlgC [Hydrocarboniclastica marina]MAL98382.1 flagellar basal body rod protein FlgC [Alteromonadaceae bacterium]QCF25854.1 flagellar basal body rod protein FlgC [Hydrocarboniclastica marina]